MTNPEETVIIAKWLKEFSDKIGKQIDIRGNKLIPLAALKNILDSELEELFDGD